MNTDIYGWEMEYYACNTLTIIRNARFRIPQDTQMELHWNDNKDKKTADSRRFFVFVSYTQK